MQLQCRVFIKEQTQHGSSRGFTYLRLAPRPHGRGMHRHAAEMHAQRTFSSWPPPSVSSPLSSPPPLLPSSPSKALSPRTCAAPDCSAAARWGTKASGDCGGGGGNAEGGANAGGDIAEAAAPAPRAAACTGQQILIICLPACDANMVVACTSAAGVHACGRTVAVALWCGLPSHCIHIAVTRVRAQQSGWRQNHAHCAQTSAPLMRLHCISAQQSVRTPAGHQRHRPTLDCLAHRAPPRLAQRQVAARHPWPQQTPATDPEALASGLGLPACGCRHCLPLLRVLQVWQKRRRLRMLYWKAAAAASPASA